MKFRRLSVHSIMELIVFCLGIIIVYNACRFVLYNLSRSSDYNVFDVNKQSFGNLLKRYPAHAGCYTN